jgi:hypothetical protein
VNDDDLDVMAARLAQVPGVVGVLLGGSRARGEHTPDSDWDLGVYYRGAPDLGELGALAGRCAGEPVEVTAPGGWGPWVDGGAWLRVDGVAVDWILRDVDRVGRVLADCATGTYEVGSQPGHPLGFWSPCYAGEVALGRVLADPGKELTELQSRAAEYPEPLRAALVGASWEAEFLVSNAAKGARRGDALFVSLSLSRAVGVLVQSLYAWHRRWCLNEKGALAVAEALPGTPAGFGVRARALLAAPGATPDELSATVAVASELVTDVRAALRP